ncbi:MAG: hypothetical protein OEM96_00020 [Gemmatimonadota bacterium]|nr:hypothetical protein [Gemmatimonadota bacterium]
MHGVPGVWVRMGGVGALLAAVACSVPSALQAQDGEAGAEVEASAPKANPADVESIDAILTAVYTVISGEAGEERDWDRFRSLFIPEARLIPTGYRPDGTHAYIVWSPDQYIEAAGAQLVANGFFEQEEHRVTEQWEDIAHAFSTYNSYRTEADMEAGTTFMRGINSFQLMWDGERWWVVSIMWEAEGPDRPLTEGYLGKD